MIFPLPIIVDCLDTLQGAKFFSTLNMASGYCQVEIGKKTAFITRNGLFEHTRMGMGLCNAPGTFQRAMQLVQRLTWIQVLVYLDDVIVLGKDFADGLANVRTTLQRFREYFLKLKPKKCDLIRPETKLI